MFLTFCQDQQYPTPAGFGRILKPLLKKPAIRKADQSHRAFTDEEELRLLFLSPAYRDGTQAPKRLLGAFYVCSPGRGRVNCVSLMWGRALRRRSLGDRHQR